MKNCKVDFLGKKIVVSEAFMRKASIPFSDQYNELKKLVKSMPDYEIEVIPSKKRGPRNQQQAENDKHRPHEA